MKKYLLYILLICCLACSEKKADKSSSKKSAFKLEVFQADHHSYGFEIRKGQKLVSRQESIPLAGRKEGFRSPKDARKVGELMIRKLEQGALSPTVSQRELDSLQIRY